MLIYLACLVEALQIASGSETSAWNSLARSGCTLEWCIFTTVTFVNRST